MRSKQHGGQPTKMTHLRTVQAVQMRTRGATYRQIATEFGCSAAVVYRAVSAALLSERVEAVDDLRAVECERLDGLIAKAWEVVDADHPYVSNGRVFEDLQDSGPVLAALALIMRLSESKRRLLGLDAPSRQTITVISEDVIDAECRRLEQEMAALTAADEAERVTGV